ncbi:CotH kinase family protein [Prochlorococcus sp. AH-736-P13]|nr:CotH kinase family protein [Prochlorococcus sp. AH-736-P13]
MIFEKKKRLFGLSLVAFFVLLISLVPHNLGLGRTEERFYKKGLSYITNIVFANGNKSNIVDEMISYRGNFVGIFYRNLRSSLSKPKVLELNLSFKNLNRLQQIRDEALKNGILIRSPKDEVSGKINYLGKEYPIKIRLKGDWTDHLVGNQWSFRIKAKDGKRINGLKEFSLQHPRTRGYINEYLYHKILKREKLPYLRYEFVKLRLNGKDLGIYALEEHFTKLLLENSGFREGPILRLNEDKLWEDWKESINIDGTILSIDINNEKNAEIKDFNSNTNSKFENKNSQFYLAENLLNQFLSGKLKASEIFDLRLTSRYFAINDLLSAKHSEIWHNLRFYFNPINSRFVPIGFDAHQPIRTNNRSLAIDRNVLNIFSDNEFISYYVSELERLSNLKSLNEMIKSEKNDINRNLSIIHKSYPHVKFLEDEIYKNAKYIQSRLLVQNPISAKQTETGLNKEQIKVILSNSSKFPVEILSIETNLSTYKPINSSVIDGYNNVSRITQFPIVLSATKGKNNRENLNSNQLIIKYKVLGSNRIDSYIINTKPWAKSTSISNPVVSRDSNIYSFDFLNIDEIKKIILIKQGDYIIDKPLIIPKGYLFRLKEGVKIKIIKEGLIFSESSISFEGSDANPIFISGQENGKGLIISNVDSDSNLNHVVFDGLSAPDFSSLAISGAVNFYKSNVYLNNVKFLNSSAEDALNIFQSKFKLTNVLFHNAFSDAFDSDFSEGVISKTIFRDVGNDGLDISGSNVKIYSSQFEGIPDKAISAGEKSNLTASNINIKKAGIAIASKDLSIMNLNNLRLENVELCLSAFQKKEEYGPASITVNGIDSKDCLKNYLLENGSNIIINESPLLPNTSKVIDQLYGKRYGKKTVK